MMNITDMENIKSNFIKVIEYSQGIKEPKVDELFDLWYHAKNEFIDAWGGQLIYEVEEEIVFELSEQEKNNRLNEFINVVYDTYMNCDLGNFLYNTRKDFFKNHLSEDYIDREKNIKIAKGSKILKAFKLFEENEKVIDALQTQASMLIQENKVRGKLCFSVHPLDYLSVSENTYHWRSCHALDGDYRTGNLSYMTDECTVICYLKGENEVKLPRFPEDVLWNSKKWRMLLFVSENRDALFAGRQYPFFSETALNVLRPHYINSMGYELSRWSNFHNDYIEKFPRADEMARTADENLKGRYLSMQNTIMEICDIVEDTPNPLHYNDLLESSFYRQPYYAWMRPRWWDYPSSKKPKFILGSSVGCLCCNNKKISFGNLMRCNDCEANSENPCSDYFARCNCCDSTYLRENGYYCCSCESMVCPECRDEECDECEQCGELWYKCDIIFERTLNKHICPYCQQSQSQTQKLKRFQFVFDDDLPF